MNRGSIIVFYLMLGAAMELVHQDTLSLTPSRIFPNRKLLLVQQNSSISIDKGLKRSFHMQRIVPSKGISLDVEPESISVSQLAIETTQNNGANPNTTPSTTTTTTTTTTATTTTTHDPNSDLDEPGGPSQNPQDNSTDNKSPNKDDPGNIGSGGGGSGGGKNGPNRNNNNNNNNLISDNNQPGANERINIELSVLWYSVFMVYVSFVKLIYHNVAIIKRNLTEPGILMIFGIIWELISRQLKSSSDVSPRFNSRIFFYLFLPSTVLESASILSNKWLLLNLLPILVHSIVGTLLYSSAIAFTIHSMSKQNMFDISTTVMPTERSMLGARTSGQAPANFVAEDLIKNGWLENMNESSSPDISLNLHQQHQHSTSIQDSSQITTTSSSSRMMLNNDDPDESIFLYEKSYVIDAPILEVGNLTLADCLVFGSIMSSLDSTTILGAFSMFQVDEKLYYLVLGESLMNNAVVLIVFNLLLDFLNASRLTVVKIYIAIIQFFITLIGSIFVGLLLASVALLAVRLIKRFQVPSALTSYQNQCLAMIETLLVLKLAYLTYTLGNLAGLSSIISLATFAVLQDQYIRLNLNLRSQLTFRQVILATRTMGYSLIYPLLGMLLVDVAYASQNNLHHHQQQQQQLLQVNQSLSGALISDQINQRSPPPGTSAAFTGAATLAATKLTSLAQQTTGLFWNFKFLSLVTAISVVYRFGIVILLSSFCNLISNRKVRVRFREQLLMAYGGLKGPLAVALVHRLIEHEDHRDRLMRNKHLFMYTILFITLLSVIFKGAFIRTLVEKMQISLQLPDQQQQQQQQQQQLMAKQEVVLFNAINNKVIEGTVQAVNNMLGQTKSSYDRLFEFNETRIKPWLARDGSNTYWLSNLYDKLLLDETLDSNCFYKSPDEPIIAGSFWHSKVHPSTINEHRRGATASISNELPPSSNSRQRGSKSSLKLDTINEYGGGFIDDDELNAMNSHLGLSVQQQPRQVTTTAAAVANKQRQQVKDRRATNNSSSSIQHRNSRHSSSGLKEFVLADLRSHIEPQDLGRKKRPIKLSNKPVELIGAGLINDGATFSKSYSMISSSSRDNDNDDDDEKRSRLENSSHSDKEDYISQLDRHLENSKKSRSTSSNKNSKSDLAVATGANAVVVAAAAEPQVTLPFDNQYLASHDLISNYDKRATKLRHDGREKFRRKHGRQAGGGVNKTNSRRESLHHKRLDPGPIVSSSD